MYTHTPTRTYIQVSCLSSSPVLSNRDRFFYYFQILASDGEVALGFFELIQKFQWRKVKLIVENQHTITSVSRFCY